MVETGAVAAVVDSTAAVVEFVVGAASAVGCTAAAASFEIGAAVDASVGFVVAAAAVWIPIAAAVAVAAAEIVVKSVAVVEVAAALGIHTAAVAAYIVVAEFAVPDVDSVHLESLENAKLACHKREFEEQGIFRRLRYECLASLQF